MLSRNTRRLVLAALVVVSTAVYAQRGGGGYYGVRRPTADTFKGDFTFCRLAFRGGYGGYGGGWGVDYPRADENLSIRLSELSEAAVNFDRHGTPNYVVIQATEPELFKCPFLMVTNHGNASFAPEEVEALRAYLKKGGFLWADDAWGSNAWDHWLAELRKILPAAEYPLVDLPHQPLDFPHAVRGETHSANSEHRLLSRLGRTDVGAVGRQSNSARLCPRRQRTAASSS